jgi:hypothetical protein
MGLQARHIEPTFCSSAVDQLPGREARSRTQDGEVALEGVVLLGVQTAVPSRSGAALQGFRPDYPSWPRRRVR